MISAAAAPSPPPTTTFTTKATPRGLESKSSQGALRKKCHRQQAISAVLSERRREQRFGIKDDKAIADGILKYPNLVMWQPT
jgi:hypothetical protein